MKIKHLIVTFFALQSCFAFGQDSFYKHVKDLFYTDKYGNLYFRSQIPSTSPKPVYVYVMTMPLNSWDRSDTLKNSIDLISYKTLNRYFAKDKNHVYWFSYTSDGTSMSILKEADPASFATLKDAPGFGKDKNSVFKNYCKVDSCLPSSKLRMIKSPGTTGIFYFTDEVRVYYDCAVVTGADPKTFKSLDYKSGKDKNGEYMRATRRKETTGN